MIRTITHNYCSVYSAVAAMLKKYRFRSVRPAKNMNHHLRYVRPDKRLYKYIFNHLLCVSFKRHANYFMSFDEYQFLRDKDFGDCVIELMCHPDYEGNVLINRVSLAFEELSGGLTGKRLISYSELP